MWEKYSQTLNASFRKQFYKYTDYTIVKYDYCKEKYYIIDKYYYIIWIKYLSGL